MPTKKEPKAPKPPRTRRRYSIGEWYGRAFEAITPIQRYEQANLEIELDGISNGPCPFRPEGVCNKKGGVCSLRLYEQTGAGPVAGAGPLITTCPNRFLEQRSIFCWVGETLLQTSEPVVLGEIGFLDRIAATPVAEADEEDARDFIGRIDDVLVHPSRDPLDWCALELQAVYFSGKSMRREFTMLAAGEQPALPFPAAHRRPDWRSSGPKRLLPQLQTKVPTIRTWGKKTAVVIDEAFFSSLVGLESERHLSNAEVAWFVVRYENAGNAWRLTPSKVVYTKLDSSVKALTGGVPLSKERFEDQLRSKLRVAFPAHPLLTAT
jgi:hypothetical protein